VANLSANEDSGLIRIDHRISDSTSLYARYNIDQVFLTSPSGNLLDKTQTSTAPMNGVVTLSHVFSPTSLNVAEVGVNRIWALSHTDSHFFDTTGIFNAVSIPGFEPLNQEADSVKAPSTYTLKDDHTWTRGLHTVKAGVEIKHVAYNYSQASQNGLVYASLPLFAANQLDQVNLLGGVPMHGLLKTEYFGYVQDAWKVRPEFTLNVGLRYEFFNAFHEQYGRDLPFDPATCNGGYCPQGSAFDFPKKLNLEPRLSLAWAPKALHDKTVIRTGSGFYKGEGQLGDLNAPSDNFTQRLSLSSASFPGLSFPADSFYAEAANNCDSPCAFPESRRSHCDSVGISNTTGFAGRIHSRYRLYRLPRLSSVHPVVHQRVRPLFEPMRTPPSGLRSDRYQTDGFEQSFQCVADLSAPRFPIRLVVLGQLYVVACHQRRFDWWW
jgi:hypothetical protein